MKKGTHRYCKLNVTIPASLKEEEDICLDKGCIINIKIASTPVLRKVYMAYLDHKDFVEISSEDLDFLKSRINAPQEKTEQYNLKHFSYCLVLTSLYCEDPHQLYSTIDPGTYININLASIPVLKKVKATHAKNPGLIWFQPHGLKALNERLRYAAKYRLEG